MTPEERASKALWRGKPIPADELVRMTDDELADSRWRREASAIADEIRAAVAEERESCATTAETMECPVHGDDYPRCMFDDDIGDAACREKRRSIAAMIRARGTA